MSDPIVSNAYAVAFRLVGVESIAHDVALAASQRVRDRFQTGGGVDLDSVAIDMWLPMLIDYAVDESVRRTPRPEDIEEFRYPDQHSSMREALRRRLVRASRQERVIGALVHLSGYSIDDVAEMLKLDPPLVAMAAKVIAPPPGFDYRRLGDPQLIGTDHLAGRPTLRLPATSTIAAAIAILIVVLAATMCHGPRPSLVEEGSLSLNLREAIPHAHPHNERDEMGGPIS
ncbi:MAG: hypothetical protein V9F03_02485 [Microthrixaceae bacterium]